MLGGAGDSPIYYGLYLSPLYLHAGIAPFALRQVSVVLTWLVWHAHLYYPNLIAFAEPAYDQRIFFAALLVNWVSLVLSALVAGLILEELPGARHKLLSLLAALLCLLSFQAQVSVITDLAEGPGWLLLGFCFLCLLRRSTVWLAPALVLSVFERELILVAIACVAVSELLSRSAKDSNECAAARSAERRFPLYILCAVLLCPVAYVVLRHRYAGYDSQVQPAPLLSGLLRIDFDRSLLFQAVLSQNVLPLAVVGFFASSLRLKAFRYWMPRALTAFFVLMLVTLSASAGNNAGRLTAIVTPIFAALATLALAQGYPAELNLLPAGFIPSAHALDPEATPPLFVRESRTRNATSLVLISFATLFLLLAGASQLSRSFGPQKIRHKQKFVPAQPTLERGLNPAR